MRGFLMLAIAASVAATGCGVGVICYARSSTYTIASHDGLGSLPQKDAENSGTSRETSEPVASDAALPGEAELAALKPYSPQWWSVRDAIDRAADAQLAKKLIICQGCFPSEHDDGTGLATAEY
jgi:hypothetical protein